MMATMLDRSEMHAASDAVRNKHLMFRLSCAMARKLLLECSQMHEVMSSAMLFETMAMMSDGRTLP